MLLCLSSSDFKIKAPADYNVEESLKNWPLSEISLCSSSDFLGEQEPSVDLKRTCLIFWHPGIMI
jgi:hypothetical protein